MRRIILTTTALVCLTAAAARGNTVADSIVDDLQSQGFKTIEVLIGPTQIKVEAYQPGTKFESVYDLATGEVLKQETETLSSDDEDDDFSPGVEIEDVATDFLDSSGSEITDDEALNDPFARQVVGYLTSAGYTYVEVLIGPTQVRARAARETGEVVEVIYDRATGSIIRETSTQGEPYDDDFAPGVLIEDIPYDFLDADGNEIARPDDDPEDFEEEIDDDLEDAEDDDMEEDEEEEEEDDSGVDGDDDDHGGHEDDDSGNEDEDEDEDDGDAGNDDGGNDDTGDDDED